MDVKVYTKNGRKAGKTVFEGWFPPETDAQTIRRLVGGEIPGKLDPGAEDAVLKTEMFEAGYTETAKEKSIDGKIMVVLLPGERPYAAVIPDTLSELQRSVNGYIEITYPFDDNCLIIGNDEAKLIGMKGNRRIFGEVYAGPLLIAGDDNDGGFCDLTPEQVEKYIARFIEPEQISMREVDDSIKIEIYAL